MSRQVIRTTDAPSSPLYSQGVRAGSNVVVSGMVGIDPSTGSMAGATIQEQARQALQNCRVVLEAGGASLADVTEVGVLLTNSSDFSGLNEEYAHWFPTEPPARYVARLGVEIPGVLVSIRMTAFVQLGGLIATRGCHAPLRRPVDLPSSRQVPAGAPPDRQ